MPDIHKYKHTVNRHGNSSALLVGNREVEIVSQVNSQVVIQALGSRIAALSVENAVLQARISELEAELHKLKATAELHKLKATKVELSNEKQPGVATK